MESFKQSPPFFVVTTTSHNGNDKQQQQLPQVPPATFFDLYGEGREDPIIGTVASVVQQLKRLMGTCKVNPKCRFCKDGAGDHPPCCMNWDHGDNFFEADDGGDITWVELQFQTCYAVLQGPGTKATTAVEVYSESKQSILDVVAGLGLKRLRYEEESPFRGIFQSATYDSTSSLPITESLRQLQVFEYHGLNFANTRAVQTLEDIILQCHGLEHLDIYGYTLDSDYSSEDDDSDENEEEGINIRNLPEADQLALQLASVQRLERALRQASETNKTLKVVKLTFIHLPDECLARLVGALSSHATLEHLSLKGNLVGPIAMQALGGLLERGDDCNVKFLNLSDLSTNTENPTVDVSALSKGLKMNTSLNEIKFEESNLDDVGVGHFCEALGVNTTLQKITMAHDCISSHSIELIGNALSTFHGVFSLDLTGNENISIEAFEAFGAGLAGNTSLCDLNMCFLECNTPNHLESVFGALSTNTSLTSLNVSHHDLSSKSLDAVATLASALTTNTSLEALDLSSCMINDEGVGLLARQLPRMAYLKSLNLSMNDFRLEGVKALLDGLKDNFVLTELIVATSYTGPRRRLIQISQEYSYGLINFYLVLNQFGRRLLGTPFPPSLLPLVLARADHNSVRKYNNAVDTSVILDIHYTLLRNNVMLLS